MAMPRGARARYGQLTPGGAKKLGRSIAPSVLGGARLGSYLMSRTSSFVSGRPRACSALRQCACSHSPVRYGWPSCRECTK
eukprot:4444445-Prymnesium_polylepis.1